MEEIRKEIKVDLVRENPDGSAVYTFELPGEACAAFMRLGIITALKAGIEEARQYHPEYNADESGTD